MKYENWEVFTFIWDMIKSKFLISAKVNSKILNSIKKIRISEFAFAKVKNFDFIGSHININSSEFSYFGTFFTQIPYEKKKNTYVSTCIEGMCPIKNCETF